MTLVLVLELSLQCVGNDDTQTINIWTSDDAIVELLEAKTCDICSDSIIFGEEVPNSK